MRNSTDPTLFFTMVAALLFTACTKPDPEEGLPLSRPVLETRESVPFNLISGNPGCYRLAGECFNLQCTTQSGVNGLVLYDPIPWTNGPYFHAGGFVFQKGSTPTSYGPWYYFVPLGVTGTFQRLKARFRGDFVAGVNGTSFLPKIATYVPATKTWTIEPGNGATVQLQLVTSSITECY